MAKPAPVSKLEPPPLAIELTPAAAKAFAKAVGQHGYVDDIAKAARALAKALDRAGQAKLLALIDAQARALAPLGALQTIPNKARRMAAFERVRQVEVLAYAARLASPSNDAALAALAKAVPDGSIRAQLVTVLSGGQIALPLGAGGQLAAFLDDASTSDEVVLRCAAHASFATDPTAARARARRALAGAGKAKKPREVAVLRAIMDGLEDAEPELAGWPEVFPLATHPNARVASKAQHLIARQSKSFLGYLAWAVDGHDDSAVIDVISKQLYWAMLPGKGLTKNEVAPALGALLARATARKAKASVESLTRAMRKLGLVAAAPAVDRGTPVASVGTEGGPPLLVPAKHLAEWLGVDGPKPFDTGGSDYERACDAKHPSVLAIGRGHGVVLDGQHCDVFAEPTGLFLLAEGDPAEEVAKAWKKVGALAVPAGGLVVLDAAEAGKRKGVNRKSVALTAGTYEVLAHKPKGLGGDLSAARLVRAKRG